MSLFGFLGGLLGGGKGGGRNVVAETIEVFRPNAERSAQRAADHATAALDQYAAEFHVRSNRTWIDVIADAANRLVRPIVTIGILYPIPATIINPARMSEVWTALATLPAGYWAVIGIVLPFYFGGRMQVKALNAKTFTQAAGAALSLVGRDGPEDGDIAAQDEKTGGSGENRALSDIMEGKT